MYLALSLVYLGAVLLMNSVWMLLILPLLIAVLYLTVIRREERYLGATFGSAYGEYLSQVRRWL
jgi:protein-S-isoprenylcysteine O-methyltransferase Ste14